jgi:hypothetical protein
VETKSYDTCQTQYQRQDQAGCDVLKKKNNSEKDDKNKKQMQYQEEGNFTRQPK